MHHVYVNSLISSQKQDLFFRYTWNNFLHVQVELCIAAILSQCLQEGRNASIVEERNTEESLNGNTEECEKSVPEQEDLMITHVNLFLSHCRVLIFLCLSPVKIYCNL